MLTMNNSTKKNLTTGILILIVLMLLWRIFMQKSKYGKKSGYDFYDAKDI